MDFTAKDLGSRPRTMATIGAIFLILVALTTPALARARPGAPDLERYTAVPAAPFGSGSVSGEPPVAVRFYFQTPDGLHCALLEYAVGCTGDIPNPVPGVHEIGLTNEDSGYMGGLATKAADYPVFADQTAPPPPVLREGQKLVAARGECAVGPGRRTSCTFGQPPTQWLVITPSTSYVGPGTDGLSISTDPDPQDFVANPAFLSTGPYLVRGPTFQDDAYTFRVGNDLTCTIPAVEDRDIGCDGPLPGPIAGQNEVVAKANGITETRRTENPITALPKKEGPFVELPIGYKVDGAHSVCMATSDGVACYRRLNGLHSQVVSGFVITPEYVHTF